MMRLPEFDYVRAESVEEALALLNGHDDAMLLSAGLSLIPAMKLRFSTPGLLVDISGLTSLKNIERLGGRIRIGALCSHAELIASEHVPDLLRQAAASIGDPHVRNRGTIGGNIARPDPSADLPTALVALEAEIQLAGEEGRRAVSAEEFFLGLFSTAMMDDEIIIAVEIDGARNGAAGYEKMAHPASGGALVAAAVSLAVDGGRIGRATVAMGGLTVTPRRCRSVEEALSGRLLSDSDLSLVVRGIRTDVGEDMIGDHVASEEYRLAIAPVIARRAVTKAIARM